MGIHFFIGNSAFKEPQGFPEMPHQCLGTERTSDSIIHGGGACMFFPVTTTPRMVCIPLRIHGTNGIFLPTWMVDFFLVNVGEYTSPMDPMGMLCHQDFQVPKMELLNLKKDYFGGMGFPLRMPYPYSLCRWGFFHFRVRTEMFGDYLPLWNIWDPLKL